MNPKHNFGTEPDTGFVIIISLIECQASNLQETNTSLPSNKLQLLYTEDIQKVKIQR
jgi:hypothetical protein